MSAPLVPPKAPPTPRWAQEPPAPFPFPALRSRRTGKTLVPVGGGSMTNTWRARIVVRKDGTLAPLAFARRSGHLACSCDQAYVVAEPGDLIVELRGDRPASPETASADVWRIIGFHDRTRRGGAIPPEDALDALAVPTDTTIDLRRVPDAVWAAANEYHNRNGAPFGRRKEEWR